LKAMRMMFMSPRVQSMMPAAPPSGSREAKRVEINPMTPLTAGPAKAICSSRRGLRGISSTALTPPKK
jgi:hypothetical protein